MELQFENGIHLHRSKAAADGARSFTFDAAQFVFTTVEFYAFDFFCLPPSVMVTVSSEKNFSKFFFGFGPAGTSADDTDDFVQVVERDLIASQNVFAFACFAQIETRAAQNHVAAMLQNNRIISIKPISRGCPPTIASGSCGTIPASGCVEKIIENEL
jgi:hypothetical protein